MANIELKDLLPGKTYNIQVRAKNDSGEYSEWSDIKTFVTPADKTQQLLNLYQTSVGDPTSPTTTTGILKSANFDGTIDPINGNITFGSEGSNGWAIDYTGYGVFNNIYLRGNITATSGKIGRLDISDSADITNPSLFVKSQNNIQGDILYWWTGINVPDQTYNYNTTYSFLQLPAADSISTFSSDISTQSPTFYITPTGELYSKPQSSVTFNNYFGEPYTVIGNKKIYSITSSSNPGTNPLLTSIPYTGSDNSSINLMTIKSSITIGGVTNYYGKTSGITSDLWNMTRSGSITYNRVGRTYMYHLDSLSTPNTWQIGPDVNIPGTLRLGTNNLTAKAAVGGTGTTSGSGSLTVTHNLGTTPSSVVATVRNNTASSSYQRFIYVGNITSTSFTVFANTGSAYDSVPFAWMAVE